MAVFKVISIWALGCCIVVLYGIAVMQNFRQSYSTGGNIFVSDIQCLWACCHWLT